MPMWEKPASSDAKDKHSGNKMWPDILNTRRKQAVCAAIVAFFGISVFALTRNGNSSEELPTQSPNEQEVSEDGHCTYPFMSPHTENDQQQVEDLQVRLHEMGYYNTSIDGFYDSATHEAVRLFQIKASEEGLYDKALIDGYFGPKTCELLGEPFWESEN